MLALLAQMRPLGAYSFGELAIGVVIVAAVVALAMVAVRKFGITIPEWFIHCIWIVIVAFVVIFCIRLVMGM